MGEQGDHGKLIIVRDHESWCMHLVIIHVATIFATIFADGEALEFVFDGSDGESAELPAILFPGPIMP